MHDISSTDSLTEENYNLVFWVPVFWPSEKDGLRLRVKGLGILQWWVRVESRLLNLWSLCCFPWWMLCFIAGGGDGQGCVVAQLFANARYGYIRCWIHPKSRSLLNHISPGPCSTDPGLSCRRTQPHSGRSPKCKIHFWLDRDVSRRAKGELPCVCRGRWCRWPSKSSWGPLFPCSCRDTSL